MRVLENRVLKRIFRLKSEEVVGGWRRVHNEELHNLYPSSSIIRMIKSWRVRWAGHVVCMGERRSTYRILVGKPEGTRPLEDPRLRGRIILKWILERQDGVVWTGLIWFRIVTSGELL
jgi:hypothetical protein